LMLVSLWLSGRQLIERTHGRELLPARDGSGYANPTNRAQARHQGLPSARLKSKCSADPTPSGLLGSDEDASRAYVCAV